MIVPVEKNRDYWYEVLLIRNLNAVGFGDTNQIDWVTHTEFMFKNHEHYFVMVEEGRTVGFVGCVNNDIRVGVHPQFQNRGYGKQLIFFIKEKYPDGVAKIKDGNEASVNLFTSCGFQPTWHILENNA